MPGLYAAIHDCLNSVLCAEMAARSSVAIADDPFGVRLCMVPDPSAGVNRVMRLARDKHVKDESFKNMIEYAASPDYEKAVGSIIRHTNYPAPLVSAWAECLPHAVIRSLTVRAERNETLLRSVGFKVRKAARAELMVANRRAVTTYSKLIGIPLPAPFNYEHGSQYASHLYRNDEQVNGVMLT